jgi:hypothetical protein
LQHQLGKLADFLIFNHTNATEPTGEELLQGGDGLQTTSCAMLIHSGTLAFLGSTDQKWIYIAHKMVVAKQQNLSSSASTLD